MSMHQPSWWLAQKWRVFPSSPWQVGCKTHCYRSLSSYRSSLAIQSIYFPTIMPLLVNLAMGQKWHPSPVSLFNLLVRGMIAWGHLTSLAPTITYWNTKYLQVMDILFGAFWISFVGCLLAIWQFACDSSPGLCIIAHHDEGLNCFPQLESLVPKRDLPTNFIACTHKYQPWTPKLLKMSGQETGKKVMQKHPWQGSVLQKASLWCQEVVYKGCLDTNLSNPTGIPCSIESPLKEMEGPKCQGMEKKMRNKQCKGTSWRRYWIGIASYCCEEIVCEQCLVFDMMGLYNLLKWNCKLYI